MPKPLTFAERQKRRRNRALWKAAVKAAKVKWKKLQAARFARNGGRRFEKGGPHNLRAPQGGLGGNEAAWNARKAKHLRGYHEAVQRLARPIYRQMGGTGETPPPR